jgi:mycothiol synthase
MWLRRRGMIGAGFVLRPGSLSDAAELGRMLTRCTQRYLGRSTSAEETLDRLTQAGPEPERTAVIAVAPDGRFLGFGNVWPAEAGEVKCFARVDPDATGRGIGASLLDALETNARTLGATLTATQWAADESGAGLLRARGFEPSRFFLRMVGDLTRLAEGHPELPSGAAVRPFQAGDEEELYEAWSAAFSSEAGEAPESAEAWWRERRDALAAGYDPDLWLLAVAGGEIVGFSICKEIDEDGGRSGYVSDLGVLPSHRGQGLGSTLLRLSFRALRRRDLERVVLDVDAENTTSALRLYRGVGLCDEPRFTIWSKPLGVRAAGAAVARRRSSR